MWFLMDASDVRIPETVALSIRLVPVETGEARLKPTAVRERFRGFHPVDARHPTLFAGTARSVNGDVLSGNRVENGHGSLPCVGA
jgi:hypothetical protein